MSNNRGRTEEDRYYDKFKRDKDSKSFYNSTDWQKVREQALTRDNYLCRRCFKQKKLVPADMVHHIVPLRDDPGKGLELDNLESLCHPCHNKEHGGKETKEVKIRAARIIQSNANSEVR
ncbi:HNH endonuclease [Paenibacillus sp. GCM10023248]|uniref:HNH endonuclease n=1 Tax=unclassified Paenibacillus TaxID=185978 RepID=UPI002379446A|nr:HNH endonuclease signature motif containing protein [Paenibacillus sp. MAHUQ-63]MDD9266064.1 HNH endonuclease signature motif containing protein [Paenibacillus sp. MAHUQ-63]